MGVAALPRVAPVFGPVVDRRGLRLLRFVARVALAELAFGLERMVEMALAGVGRQRRRSA